MFRARYRRILWFFAGVLAKLLWWDILLPHLGLLRLSRRSRRQRLRGMAAAFRQMAAEMGGVMIKVGQFLSARLDVLPEEITGELASLQDEVAPESFENVRLVIENEFGRRLEEVYADFQAVPLAAASIGQVHRALVAAPAGQNGAGSPPARVVVKVQRPHIRELVDTDLSALRVVGKWIDRYPPVRRRANVPALLEEFSRSLYEEIDYLHEGQNAESFANNFSGVPHVKVPAVFWKETTRRVLTLEDVYAIKITDYDAIEAAGIDRARVAERLLDTYLKQIFEDHFFHADPHPGNLFVLAVPPAEEGARPDWELIFVDFGMAGRVEARILEGLRDSLVAVATRDAARVVRAFQELGMLLPGANLDLLERAIAEAFDRFWGKTTTEMMEMGRQQMIRLAEEFRGLIYEMPFQLPENMILLGRCLSILDGMCTGLDPDFNFWVQLTPYAQKILESEQGGRWGFLLNEVVDTLRTLAGLPHRADALMARMERGRLEVRTPELKEQIAQLNRALRKLVWAILFSSFLFAGVQLYLAGHVVAAAAAEAAALFVLLWLLLKR